MTGRKFDINKKIRTTEERLEKILSGNGRNDYSDLDSVLLNSADLRALFSISARTLDHWVKNTSIQVLQKGGKNYFSLAVIHKLLQEHRYPKATITGTPTA